MKKKLLSTNDLDKSLTKKCQKTMERIDVSELKDFPQLTAETIRKKLLLFGIKLVKVFLIWQSILIGMVITKSE